MVEKNSNVPPDGDFQKIVQDRELRREDTFDQWFPGADVKAPKTVVAAHLNFDETAWIGRLAATLEQVAAEAKPSYSPPPPTRLGIRPIGEYESALNRGYHDLAARAIHDPVASKQFEESHLWVRAYPAEAIAILREYPLVKPGLEGAGENEGIRFRVLNRIHRPDLKSLVSCLAKLSVKEGGEETARRLHRYLTAGVNGTVPAYEITDVTQ